MDKINWVTTCCGWHGEYAEHATKDGGIARLKRTENLPGIVFVCRFDKNNKAVDHDGDGIPDYIQMTEIEVLELLAI